MSEPVGLTLTGAISPAGGLSAKVMRAPGRDDGAAPHRVVIVGGGFGGLAAVKALAGAGVDITLIDQRNHHIFQPLLYQVATASLATSDVAWPIRNILRGRKDVSTRLATVCGVDTARRTVLLADGSDVPYDSLVLATGARHGYFGHDEWEPFALGLKTIEDATTIRRHLLLAFERAEQALDSEEREALLSFVVIGAGPTGVELAGTIAELARDTLPAEFRRIDTHEARVHLIEAGPRVLPGYDADLSDYARRKLEEIGVTVELGQPVASCSAEGVTYGSKRLAARTIIWAAGVQASPAAAWLGAEADRNGRIKVQPDLTVPGHPEIFAIGDTIAVAGPNAGMVPGIAPAAKQGGRHVAATIRARLAGDRHERPFAYRHEGSLAQIGKRVAVIDFGWIKLRGALAWWMWGIAHIYFLISTQARLSVAVAWLWNYLRNHRSARLITQTRGLSPPPAGPRQAHVSPPRAGKPLDPTRC